MASVPEADADATLAVERLAAERADRAADRAIRRLEEARDRPLTDGERAALRGCARRIALGVAPTDADPAAVRALFGERVRER